MPFHRQWFANIELVVNYLNKGEIIFYNSCPPFIVNAHDNGYYLIYFERDL